MALLVELHTKLSKYVAAGDGYDARHLESLAKCVQVREYAVGDAVYEFHQRDLGGLSPMNSGFPDHPTPPLVWLLDGAVEHLWMGTEGWPFSLSVLSYLDSACCTAHLALFCMLFCKVHNSVKEAPRCHHK
jgi:hypothetical protein